MRKQNNIIIPKPCKENWNKMTATEKGRFCAVCSKNLIDFTDKSRSEIQEILSNSQEQICGKINIEQLDSVHIEIPEYAFRKQYSFARIFAISLLLAMGTTLLSCSSYGKTKKIETVTVVKNFKRDSIKKLKKIEKERRKERKRIEKERKKREKYIKKREKYRKKQHIIGILKAENKDCKKI